MTFQNILVPIDGSQTSLAVVDKAVELAKAFNSKITVVQVMTLDPYIAAEYITAAQTNDLIERARTAILQNLEEAKQRFEQAGVQVESQLLEGQVVNTEIIRAVKTLGADLIVIGSHGRTGFKKFFLGSVAQSILGQAEVPVLVIRGQASN